MRGAGDRDAAGSAGGNDRVNEVRVETSVKAPLNPFGDKPLLAPLARPDGWKARTRETLDRLPPAAAPIAVTLAGGVAIVVVLASVFAGAPQADRQEAPAPAATQAAMPEPDDPVAAAEVEEPAAPEAPAPRAPLVAPAATVADLGTLTAPAVDASPPALGGISPDERTASIPPALPGGAFMPVVPVAETQEEIEALEAIQREEVAEDVGEPSLEETASVPPADASRVSATTTKWVNMRTGPSDEADVVEVVPALATVQAQAGCDWCAVSYEGRQGYIYKTFLSYGGAGE